MSKRRGPTPRKETPRTIDGIPGTVEPGYREHEIVQRPVPDQVREKFREMIGKEPEDLSLSIYTMGPCSIMVGREPAGKNGELLWHLTISTPSRHPTWDEIKTARYRLLPHDLTFAMLLPHPKYYVNVEAQDHVFQLWEVHDERQQWMSA